MEKNPPSVRNYYRILVPLRNKQNFLYFIPKFYSKGGKQRNKQNCFKNIGCEQTLQRNLIGECFLTLYWNLLKNAVVVEPKRFAGISQTCQNFRGEVENQASCFHAAVQTLRDSSSPKTVQLPGYVVSCAASLSISCAESLQGTFFGSNGHQLPRISEDEQIW